jgi:PAS domain-containing protein
MLSKTPLRLILIIPFVAQVTTAVGLTTWLSIRNGQQAVNEVASQLREETTARINAEIHDLLSTTRAVNDLSVKTIQREHLDLTNIRSVEGPYWDYLTTFPSILGIGLGNTEGDILGMFRRIENGKTHYFLEYSSPTAQNRYVSLQLDSQGKVIQSEVTDQRIDARKRPWYQAAVEAKGPVWTDVYTSVSQVEGHALAINASQPIYGADGQLRGVASVILDLGQVSQLLEIIELSPSGQIYILEANGNLIGSSDGHNPVSVNGGRINRLPATASKSRLIRESAAFLNTYLEGNFKSIEPSLQLDFDLEGERQYLQITPIQASDQLQWFTVVVAPASYFMGQINANTRNTILLCIAALTLATGFSMLTARWVTRPLRQLNQAAKEITQGSLQCAHLGREIAATGSREVSELSHSFNQMTRQLQASFAALRASELNFKSVAAGVPGAIIRYVVRPDGSDAVSFLNAGCYELWEIEAKVAEQDVSVLWEAVYPEDFPGMQASVLESARTLETWNHEWRITTPSGRLKWLQGTGKPTRQPDGEVFWGTVVLDVSERKATEQALKVQRDFNELIANITSRFVDLSPANLDVEIEQALQDIGEVTRVDTSYIFTLDEVTQTIHMTHEWCRPGYPRRIDQLQSIPFAAFPWGMAALKQREVIYIPQVADLPEEAAIDRASWQQFNVGAVLVVPLIQRSVVIGFMGFASFSQPMTWEDSIVRLLNVMGQTIANAQKQAQDELRLVGGEERLRLALQAANMGIWEWDIANDSLIWDERMFELYHLHPEGFSKVYEAWQARGYILMIYRRPRLSSNKH